VRVCNASRCSRLLCNDPQCPRRWVRETS
jgi:hypothetical protein